MPFLVFCFFAVLACVVPGDLLAHGTDYRVLQGKQTVAVDFFYSDKEPMRYAEVLLFSPDNDHVEYQNGRADQAGRFAFCPDRPGTWRIRVNDGMGHLVNAMVNVQPAEGDPSGADATGAVTQKQPSMLSGSGMPLRAALGLSVMLNLFFALYAWRRKGGGA